MSGLIDNISVAAGRQTRGFTHINDSVAELDDATQQYASLVEEAAAAAESQRIQAETLRETVAMFKVVPSAEPV